MKQDSNKDVIILNLLIGWEVVHLSKQGRKVTIRLKEFPEKTSRFFRINFHGCNIAAIIDFNKRQFEDFTYFDFKGCVIGNAKIGDDDLLSVFLYRNDNSGGILKISCANISCEFTSR